MRPFHWHIYILHTLTILKARVNIMHISIANFSQLLTDKANIAIINKYEVSYDLSIGIFTFDLGPF